MVQVPTGVIQLFTHPPFGVISRETGPTLTTGQYAVKRIRGPVNVDCFGIAFSFFTIPAAFGWTEGIVKRYEERICQWSCLYTDLTGHTFQGPMTDVHEEGLLYFFSDAFPTEIDISVQVGCAVVVYFLLAL
jgi:hypothetical protein